MGKRGASAGEVVAPAPDNPGTPVTRMPALTTPQRATSRLRFGKQFEASAEVEISATGLLAIGAMVGVILLGSAAIVRAAGRARADAAEAD